MKNFLTIEVESYMGAIFIVVLSAFFVGLMFISVKNFSSDITIITSEQVQVKTMSVTERVLIREWIIKNSIEMPKEIGFNYLIQEYPSRPWLK
jgi:hypothetical protein